MIYLFIVFGGSRNVRQLGGQRSVIPLFTVSPILGGVCMARIIRVS